MKILPCRKLQLIGVGPKLPAAPAKHSMAPLADGAICGSDAADQAP